MSTSRTRILSSGGPDQGQEDGEGSNDTVEPTGFYTQGGTSTSSVGLTSDSKEGRNFKIIRFRKSEETLKDTIPTNVNNVETVNYGYFFVDVVACYLKNTKIRYVLVHQSKSLFYK